MLFARDFVLWSCNQAVALVRGRMAENDEQRRYKKVRELIAKAPKGVIRRSELVKRLSGTLTAYQLDGIIELLKAADEIRVVQQEPSDRGGPGTTFYHWNGRQRSE